MAQTIWLHKLSETTKQEAEGMEYVCEHLFQSLTQTGKLVKGLESRTKCHGQRRQRLPRALL
jgi:hypothetical protein